jgi:SAM-dependent methyltransferase
MMRLPEEAGLQGLDIGSGIGGPMRWFALKTHAQMDGLDITPAFVKIAQNVNAEVGMREQCFCAVGDATRIPSDAHYDFATMMAVSCNIQDRDALYRSIYQSLKPGGVVGMLDIVKGDKDGLALPVPWSRDGAKDTSLLLNPDVTIVRAEAAGLTFESERNVSVEVLAWFQKEDRELASGRQLGFENIISDWAQMVKSQVQNLQEDKIAFFCFVFSKPEA